MMFEASHSNDSALHSITGVMLHVPDYDIVMLALIPPLLIAATCWVAYYFVVGVMGSWLVWLGINLEHDAETAEWEEFGNNLQHYGEDMRDLCYHRILWRPKVPDLGWT